MTDDRPTFRETKAVSSPDVIPVIPEMEPPDPVTARDLPMEPQFSNRGVLSLLQFGCIYELCASLIVLLLIICASISSKIPSTLIYLLIPPLSWIFAGLLLLALRGNTSKRAIYCLAFMTWKVVRVAASTAVGLFIWTELLLNGTFFVVTGAIVLPVDALIGLTTLFVTSTARKFLQLVCPPDRDPPTFLPSVRCRWSIVSSLVVLVTVELIWRWGAIVEALFIFAYMPTAVVTGGSSTTLEVSMMLDIIAVLTLFAMYAVIVYGNKSAYLLPYIMYKGLELMISTLLFIFYAYISAHLSRERSWIRSEYRNMAVKYALVVAFDLPCIYAAIVYRRWYVNNEINNTAFQFSRMNDNDVNPSNA